MANKRFKFTYLLTLLTFSFRCLSYDSEINNLKNFYIQANYFGAFFNAIGSLKGKEDAGENVTEGVFSFNEEERIEAGYSPKYVPGLAGGASIGYVFKNMRVDLEVLYSQTNLDDEDYSDKGKARYIELRRNDDVSVGTERKSPWRSGKVDIEIQEKPPNVQVKFKAAFKMKNEGFNNLAGMINVYNDFNVGEMLCIPYFGVGAGVTKVKFLGKTRYALAYQAKLGVNYPLTTNTQAFAGLRYFGILGNEFKGILPVAKILAGEKYIPAGKSNEVDETARMQSTTTTITNRFGIYGLEFGLVYRF
ncbi:MULTISPECIES: P44/Msp2 family outer membrane protein [Wolbachia]|uniref:P44/Msp2 family outer membrane protein n=1 Tax=Wolbachia endosymbiont of Ephestia elutella TaxID=3231696 RepID=A0AAU8MJU3_9RICK|nr:MULTISPECIES: P44/Msp2 family outer membrane protein [Wolbachia]UFO00653.1 P44/Msp2 family outer membrane protein [Wolbachia endosymbiont of Corcyra cephalonica]UXX39666.1 P44/Msp2 family outer membrane protein [Wolbachia endosymbiont of Oryzaephilus surinamensis]BDG75773.1 hypothetical protein wHmt_03310 [Wolbachia pipientis]BDG77235.1 hypothetical protein wHmc_03670 [Wolbachia pipientis]